MGKVDATTSLTRFRIPFAPFRLNHVSFAAVFGENGYH
jgi:hypothetical protein